MLAYIDREHRLMAVNRAWADRLGAAMEGSDPAVARSLIDLAHPEDRIRLSGELAGITPSQPAEIEGRFREHDGAYCALGLHCVRSDDPEGTMYVSVRERSREEALRAELADKQRRLAAVFESMHDMVYMTDANGVIDAMNRAPPGMSMADIIGVPMLAFAAPEEQGPMRSRYTEVRETGKFVAYETVAVFPDGTRETYSSRLGPIMDGTRSAGVVLITRNVSQERRTEEAKRYAEQQLREYMLQLERSNAELERFASIASHDLQEPLRKIQAFSDRLREKFREELPEAGRDYLERIRNAAKRMQDLINDLLMFSRLSAKEQRYTRANLNKIAKSVLSDLEVRIEETAGKVIVGELPVIDADPMHMRQLLQNLIANALKFARPEVPPVVNIHGEVIEHGPDGPTLRLLIADNGIGIEPRHHDRIFGIFERLHSRGKYEGTGVGLAVCRKIVEQHHGKITVSSVMDEGTVFTILLPMKQTERGLQP
ncbi:MAG: PAS domain S-box protein [Nannocystis sp.]|nr:PAS domain S-box protein [Nannocystis sp.]